MARIAVGGFQHAIPKSLKVWELKLARRGC